MTDGYAKVSRALLQSKSLSGHAKLIYALLQAHDGPQGCFPSLAVLVEESGWSKPTVLKAIDELVERHMIERQRRRFVNAYIFTESSTFTPCGVKDVESVEDGVKQVDSENLIQSQPRLHTESTRLTDGVKQVDSRKRALLNEHYLTREPETRTPPAPAPAPQPEPLPVVAVPKALEGFDAALQDLPGYVPSKPLFDGVLEKYGALDLEEEAIKMADWLRQPKQQRDKRQCNRGFIVGWLGRALKDVPQPIQGRAPYRSPPRNGKGPIGRQDWSMDDPEEIAAMRALGAVGLEDG